MSESATVDRIFVVNKWVLGVGGGTPIRRFFERSEKNFLLAFPVDKDTTLSTGRAFSTRPVLVH